MTPAPPPAPPDGAIITKVSKHSPEALLVAKDSARVPLSSAKFEFPGAQIGTYSDVRSQEFQGAARPAQRHTCPVVVGVRRAAEPPPNAACGAAVSQFPVPKTGVEAVLSKFEPRNTFGSGNRLRTPPAAAAPPAITSSPPPRQPQPVQAHKEQQLQPNQKEPLAIQKYSEFLLNAAAT